MGNCCCPKKEQFRREIVYACLGIDGAGKTTALKMIKGENPRNVLSTNGFSIVEMILDQQFKIKVYDVGGGERIRDIWENYYAEVHGLIFVVDASSIDRLEETCTTLKKVLNETDIRGKPTLIILNRTNSDVFDEIEFANKISLHATAAANKQHFFIAHMDNYNGQLDNAKSPPPPIINRLKKENNSLLDGFMLMTRKVIENYVYLSEGVKAAEERLKSRQLEERNKRRLRLAEIEQRRQQQILEEEETAEAQDFPFPMGSVHSAELNELNVEKLSRFVSTSIPMGRASFSQDAISIEGEEQSINLDESQRFAGSHISSEVFHPETLDERESSVSKEVENITHINGIRKSSSAFRRLSKGGRPAHPIEEYGDSIDSIPNSLETVVVRPSNRLPPIDKRQSDNEERVHERRESRQSDNKERVHERRESKETEGNGRERRQSKDSERVRERRGSRQSSTSNTTSTRIPKTAFEEERPPSRKMSRMARIKSGLGRRRPTVSTVNQTSSTTITTNLIDNTLSDQKKKTVDEDKSQTEDTVSAEKVMGSNTSLKSFRVPNGTIGQSASYSKEENGEDTVDFSHNRHETTTTQYFDKKIPEYILKGYENEAFEETQNT